MEYDAALEFFFQPSPPDAPVPEPVAAGGPARRLRDAYEPIAMHAVWSRHTNERLASLGLNFLTGYAWGRASSMGEPAPAVVASAFAFFEPELIMSLYEEGRAKVGRADLVEVRNQATIESLASVLGDTDVSPVVSVLRRGIDAADATGRPLFAGLASQPWPAEPIGQLWRACDLLREHRGDTHVAACVSAGVGAADMSVLTEVYLGMPLFSYSATRGWPEDVLQATADRLRALGFLEGDSLSATGRRLRDEIEERTDAGQQPIVDAIADDLDGVIDRLDRWSALCIEAKTFPPDVYKRAAG